MIELNMINKMNTMNTIRQTLAESSLDESATDVVAVAKNGIFEFFKATPTQFFLAILVALIASRLVKAVFERIMKTKNRIYIRFIKYGIQGIIWIFCVFYCGNLFDSTRNFITAVVTGSTLLVAVLAFAAQTSLEDLIAGILISAFQPFQIGDRVNLKNQNLTGIIEDITLRHTVIRNVANSARTIIPNSVMNKEVLENSEYTDTHHSNLLDVCVTYDSDINQAIDIFSRLVESHPLYTDQRSEADKEAGKPSAEVFIRELGENGVWLRVSVWTKTVSDNFIACSDIRLFLVDEFKKAGIHIAGPHMKLNGAVSVNGNEKEISEKRLTEKLEEAVPEADTFTEARESKISESDPVRKKTTEKLIEKAADENGGHADEEVYDEGYDEIKESQTSENVHLVKNEEKTKASSITEKEPGISPNT